MASLTSASSVPRRIATVGVARSKLISRCSTNHLWTRSSIPKNTNNNVVTLSRRQLCGLSSRSSSLLIDENKKSSLYPATSVRFLSKKKKGDDPFGLDYKDSTDVSSGNIGQKDNLPPLYTRDADTGKFTGEIEAEMEEKDRELLHLSELDKERELASRFLSSKDDQMGNVAQRIREESMALNVLGRKTSNVPQSDDDVSAALSEEEMQSLEQFLKKEYGPADAQTMLDQNREGNLIATARKSTNVRNQDSNEDGDEENPDLDLKWMTSAAQKQMEDLGVHTSSSEEEEDSFASLMPSDLNPARKVNRRLAQPTPKELLHHNNLSLLRRYVTPGGQIMNRVQSRLGAKDQRKIAKLIKRARHLGLIPYMGQWKTEDTGNIHESDIMKERDWEQELLQRGLIKRNSPIWKKTNKPEN